MSRVARKCTRLRGGLEMTSNRPNGPMGDAVMFGAGNVGRGFLGQLFSESGYRVVFVDIDGPLIAQMRSRERYTIRLVDNAHSEEVQIGPVTGLLSRETEVIADILAGASVAATAVGARALSYIAPTVAAGIRLRAKRPLAGPLNIIVCENLHGAAAIFRDMVSGHLDAREREYLAAHIGFVDTVIGRMVPELSPELRAQDPTLIIVEPYKELPVDRSGFVGPVPSIVGMEPCDNFGLYTARKLYLHNAGHAVLGYLGYRRGYSLGYEALEDAEIRPILQAALEESMRGVVVAYDADETWLRAHVVDLLARFANRVLADPVVRLGRDPLRKLAPSDRLVGAARVAEQASIMPLNLAWGIAGALAFDAPGDTMAVLLAKRIAAEGAEAVLESVSEIRRDEPLGLAVLERYRLLHEQERWQ
jgi:mannitol-1-phosphate 5-dehydrogenase